MCVDRAVGSRFELRVIQDQETGIRKRVAGRFRLRYLSARSLESRKADAPGQDYIAVRQAGTRLVFALCDGVSESFYGDLAARFLGDALVDWLWAGLASRAFERGVPAQMLSDYLSSLTPAATKLVHALALPDDVPSPLREVLEQKRKVGSETVFVCGALEVPSAPAAEGLAVFAWMGNAELQLFGRNPDHGRELDAEWDDRRRWSTRTGPRGGAPGTYKGTVRDIRHVLAYSDGMASLRQALGRGLSDECLAAEVERLGQTPTSDDVALIEIEVMDVPLSDSVTTVHSSHQGPPAIASSEKLPSALDGELARSVRTQHAAGARMHDPCSPRRWSLCSWRQRDGGALVSVRG